MVKTNSKVIINNKYLQHLINLLKGAISTKTAMQILSNIYVEINSNSLILKATDTEIGITAKATNTENKIFTLEGIGFNFTVNLDKLITILKTLPDTIDINLSYKDRQLIVTPVDKKYKTKHRLMTIDAEDYPEVLEEIKGQTFQIENPILEEGFNNTLYAVCQQEHRAHLRSIHFKTNEKEELEFISTDGRRLALYDTGLTISDNIDFVCPVKAVKNIQTIIHGNNNLTTFTINDSRIIADINIDDNLQVILTSLVIPSDYPDHTKIVPDKFDLSLELNKESFKRAILSVTALLDKNSRQIVLLFKDNQILLESYNTEHGKSHDELEIDYTGEEIKIGIDGFFVLDILNILEGDTVFFQKSNTYQPLNFAEKDSNNLHIVMPMRLAEDM